jgi:putative CocE/NonD family hydrolase
MKYEVTVQRDLAVPMRDGVSLRADLYMPEGEGPFPVLVQRTPYGKYRQDLRRYAEAGYLAVCVDLRGRHASDGQWRSFLRHETGEGEDGYDTIEWAAQLPGSSGRVGTFGGSYDAWVQWKAAATRPPSLVAMSAQTIPARMTDLEGPGTIRPGKRLHWWVTKMSAELRRRANRPGFHHREEGEHRWLHGGEAGKWLYFLPWLELPQNVFEDETEAMQAWLREPHVDPWKLDEDCREVTVPNLDIVGWFDHANGDLGMFRALMSEGWGPAREGSRLIVGPWAHGRWGGRVFGEIDFGPEAPIDAVATELGWFDYHLKGIDEGESERARVCLFVMGDNRWRDEQQWPLERAHDQILYLTAHSPANTPAGGGTMVEEPPTDPGSDHYRYDPRDPVLALFGPDLISIATDQRPHAHRQDILVYQTEPLTERVEVTGNPVVTLFAASSAPDTDFFARLIDVAPDGLARDVATGMVRARYRHGLDRPELITPGEVVEYTVRLGATSNAFLPGHRIRLDLTSSHFPAYDRNHNTAADQNADATLVPAEQTIHHGGDYLTRISLPWIP